MKIGPYEVLSRIGQGGMGSVHLARAPDGSEVAIKVLKRTSSVSGRIRFEREQRLSSSLGERDGFVPLLDSGTGPQGPYYVMPFLAGGTLRDRLRKGPLSVDDAIALGLALARATGRAHELGIVHRDLKPENVLFTGDGRPLVADLGLAKHFHGSAESAQSVLLSQAGEVLGTALYSAREQLENAATVGPRADVFSLGAILYECLAGVPAFNGTSLPDVVTRIESGEFASLGSVRPDAPAWLAEAVDRCLSRDPQKRFEDGRALASALLARGGTRGRGVRIAAATGLALLLGMGSTALALTLLHQDEGETTPGSAATSTAVSTRKAPPPPATPAARPTVRGFEPPPSFPLACHGLMNGRKTRLEGTLGTFAGKNASQVFRVALSPDRKLAVSGSRDGTVRVFELPSGNELHVFSGHAGQVSDVSVSADGKRVLSASEDGTVKLWSLETGMELCSLSGHKGPVYACAFTPDGKRAVSGGADGTVRLWDLQTRNFISIFKGHEGAVLIVAVSPDGKRALSGGADKTARLWDLVGGTELRKLTGHEDRVYGLAFLGDGQRAITASYEGTLRLWTLDGDAVREIAAHKGKIQGLAVSRDGTRALSGSDDGTIKLWDLATGEVLTTCHEERAVTAVDLSSDGKLALTGSFVGSVRLWDLTTGTPLSRTVGHAGKVNALAWSPDGKSVLSAGSDITVRVWDVARGEESSQLRGYANNAVHSLAWSPDGTRVFEGWSDATICFREMPSGQALSRNPIGKREVTSVAFSANSKEVVAGGADGYLAAWELVKGANMFRSPDAHRAGIASVAFSADGLRAYSSGLDGRLRCIDIVSRKEVAVPVSAVPGFGRFSPDATRVLVPFTDGRLHLYETEQGKELVVLGGEPAEVACTDFSVERQRAVASERGHISVWSLASGELLDRLEMDPGDEPGPVAISPDGRSFVVGTGRGPILRFSFVE